MFILIDTDLQSFPAYYDHINELDDKTPLAISDLQEITDYSPDGSFHVVDLLSEAKEFSRWEQLVLASLGARVYTSKKEYTHSPLLAGTVPPVDKLRKISVDGLNSDRRALAFAEFGVNYVGRTKLDPRDIFVLDNKKGNPLHDPSKDPTLAALYESLPNDWWATCGFISSGNPDKLKAFFEDQEDVIPITWTEGGKAKLKYCEREFVSIREPDGTTEYGIEVRNEANRLSYNLSFK